MYLAHVNNRSSATTGQTASFYKEGEYWTVGLAGSVFRLKHSKGLAYLDRLLRYPEAEFHVLDLAAGIVDHGGESDDARLPHGKELLEKDGIHVGNLGDAGEMLDDRAKTAYRRRLSELRRELDEAKELGQVERAEQLDDEIDALNKELSRAVGLRGRNRRAASLSERARQNITKMLKASVARIAQGDAALGANLSRSIRTGTFCAYRPDRNFAIEWKFAPIDIYPPQPGSRGDAPAVQPDLSPASTPALPVSVFSLAERTPFVGREAERGAIGMVIDRALNGHGSMAMIAGGPGVGKSRLAMGLVEYASQAGFRCLLGHCYERDEPVPYLPFAEIVENSLAQATCLDTYRQQIGHSATELVQVASSLCKISPNIPPPMDSPPAEKRHYLLQSLAETLGRLAQSRPLLIVLEDLQWADESTLALLIHLANRIARLPIAIVGTYRSGFADDSPVLVRTLEELIRLGIRPLKLGGLSKPEVAQMVHGLTHQQAPERLVNLIFEESQGNPFFVEEVYRHLMDEGKIFDAGGRFHTDISIDEVDVPENVRLIINRRLDRLSSVQKTVLEAAAVIGRTFSFRLLSEVSQNAVDELFAVIEKAQQMGMVFSSSQGPEAPFTFVHELVRQTLLAGISIPRRQQLHAIVAIAIEGLYPNAAKEYAGEIAEHLAKAGTFAHRSARVQRTSQAAKAGRRGEIGHITKVQPLFAAIADRGR
jgi:uncharacterized membrane protein